MAAFFSQALQQKESGVQHQQGPIETDGKGVVAMGLQRTIFDERAKGLSRDEICDTPVA